MLWRLKLSPKSTRLTSTMTNEWAAMAGKIQHGMSRHPLYKLWLNMKDRCRNPRNPYFHNYGGRGVTVCEEWMRSFPAFRQAVGDRPSPIHTLDRVDNDGHYEPTNVRWVTKREQANNQRKNRNLTHNGKTQTLAQWAREIGLVPSTLHYRIFKAGMSASEALTCPRRAGRMPTARQ